MQTVETLNCTIERTETPPYFRLTSMRKASSNSESNMLLTSSRQDLNALGNDGAMKGTIHTKRHSQQDASDHQRERSESLHFNVDNSPWLPRETFHSWVWFINQLAPLADSSGICCLHIGKKNFGKTRLDSEFLSNPQTELMVEAVTNQLAKLSAQIFVHRMGIALQHVASFQDLKTKYLRPVTRLANKCILNIEYWTNFAEQLVNWTKIYLTKVLFPKGVIEQMANCPIFDWTGVNWTNCSVDSYSPHTHT